MLVPLFGWPTRPGLIFTERRHDLRRHAGEISFPGGRQDDDETDLRITALREAEEEIGLDPARVELLGRLSDYHTRTDYRVTPVVALVTSPLELRLDACEVEEAFEVPLSFLLDPANHLRHAREFQGRQVPYYAIPYRDHYIWGATAGMLVNLYRFLAQGRREAA